MQNAQAKLVQMSFNCPNVLFELTGIKSVKVTYDYSAYDSMDGSNITEKRYMNEFIYVSRKGVNFKLTELQAVNMFCNAVNQHMYKKAIRQAADNVVSENSEYDMNMPLETYNAMDRYGKV